jgi:hypothetical protein
MTRGALLSGEATTARTVAGMSGIVSRGEFLVGRDDEVPFESHDFRTYMHVVAQAWS